MDPHVLGWLVGVAVGGGGLVVGLLLLRTLAHARVPWWTSLIGLLSVGGPSLGAIAGSVVAGGAAAGLPTSAGFAGLSILSRIAWSLLLFFGATTIFGLLRSFLTSPLVRDELGLRVPEVYLDIATLAAALIGGTIGFLWYNAFPAEVFMGDMGSMAPGGAIAGFAIVTGTEILLLLIGGIFVIEVLSLIIQVVSFKRTGKRVFLMAPIHHHFEMKAWSETKVMVRFWIVCAIRRSPSG